MSARFASASSQYLQNAAAVVTGTPVTVGCWVYPTTTGVEKTIFHLADTGTTNNCLRLVATAGNVWRAGAQAGSTEVGASAGAVTTNNWYFILAVWISDTSRRISVLSPNGSIATSSNTNARAPTGIDSMAVGARVDSAGVTACMDGNIGEFWYTNTNIQADGAQLQGSTLRQLAYFGPFSLPHIAKDIIEYRSFRSRLDSRADIPEEVYYRGTRPVWTNTNGVQLGAHPPAAVRYVPARPGGTVVVPI